MKMTSKTYNRLIQTVSLVQLILMVSILITLGLWVFNVPGMRVASMIIGVFVIIGQTVILALQYTKIREKTEPQEYAPGFLILKKHLKFRKFGEAVCKYIGRKYMQSVPDSKNEKYWCDLYLKAIGFFMKPLSMEEINGILNSSNKE